jgi:hypothetical protein
MSDFPPMTLRYFDCRGRAQHFRYYLRYRNLPFSDERVALSPDFASWNALKANRKLTGPFQKLPVLQWGEQLVCETSLIHRWLHQHLGDEAKLTTEQKRQHDMLASSCYGDLMSPLAILLWSDLMFPGSELAKNAAGTLGRVKMHLGMIERTLYEWAWWTHYEKRDFMLADFQLWELLDWAVTVFGPALSLNATPGLDEFHRHLKERKLCNDLLVEHPCQITARPGEAEAIARIRQAVA